MLDLLVPVKEVRIKQHIELWTTSNILESIKAEDKLLANYRKYKNNEETHNTFCQIKNQINITRNQDSSLKICLKLS